jgi:cell division protein FtsW (lipid II flippase)
VDTSLVLRTTSIAERANDFYSSSVTLGLPGCSLAPIAFNLGMTLNLPPETAL